MSTTLVAARLCSSAFEGEGLHTPAYWKTTVREAYSASDEHSSNNDPHMGATGGFIPNYLLKKIRKNKKEKNDYYQTNDRGSDRQILEGDGGAGSGSDSNEEGATAEAPGRGEHGETLHGERRESASEPDRSATEGWRDSS